MSPITAPRGGWTLALVPLAAALLAAPVPAAAQLRPLEPTPWQVFDADHSLTLRAGAGFHGGQRASLAGTEGRLREVGSFQAAWRSGRIALEAGGTVLRLFDDRSSFADPVSTIDPEVGPDRRDSGDYHLATLVHLTPLDRPGGLAVRFGTRLPTTDDQVGLDRDKTDFFALLAGRYRLGGASLSAETGIGIWGTRDPGFEQADLLLYSLQAEYRYRSLVPTVQLLGQKDGFKGWAMRGNEELTEVRAGLRVGERYWVQALWVRGLADFSPDSGLLLSAGLAR